MTPNIAIFSRIVGHIYEGALAPERWNDIVREIADYLNAPKGFLFTPKHVPDTGGFLFSHGVPSSFYERWPHYIAHDVPGQIAEARGVFRCGGTVVTGEMLMPSADFQETKFYKEYLSDYDMAFLLGSMVFGTEDADTMPTSFNCYRGHRDKAFTDSDCDRLRLVLPHLSRSLGVMQRLRNADLKMASTFAALDALSRGVVLVDTKCRVLFANEAAQRIFRDNDGIRLRRHLGATPFESLEADDASTQRRLSEVLRLTLSSQLQLTPHFSKAFPIQRPSGRPPLSLQMSALPDSNQFSTGLSIASAIVFISNAEEPIRLNQDCLRLTYGLTDAEIRVARLLPEGGGLDELAGKTGLSINTVRTHLRSIYEKTGTHDRVRLFRLLLSLAL